MAKKLFTGVVLVFLALNLSHCGSSATGSGSGGTTTTAVTNLETVSGELTPDSLNYAQNSASVSAPTKAASEGDPCAVVGDLFACQPILLQLYMDLAQDILDTVIDIIGGAGTAMGNVADGASGTATWEGISVQYSKTSATDYSILLLQNAIGLGYVDVSGTTYTLKMNLDGIGQGGAGQFETVVNYTDANTWTIDLLLAGMECQTDDVPAPERIKITVGKASGVWTGKAMLYNPLWIGDNTCSSTATNATAMTFYTDFVGNDTAAKANVYSMPRSKTDLSDIADWGMNNFESNFGDGFGDTSAYINSFCNPAGTLTALWNNDCSTYDAALGAASYGSADDWVTPNALYQLAVDVPDSL